MTFSALTTLTHQDISAEPVLPSDDMRLTSTEHLVEIKTVFGRATHRLCTLFDISRETLSKWLDGSEQPDTAYDKLLYELAVASRVFLASGIHPTNAMFDRTVFRGETFLQLLHQGESGATVAERLVRILQRDARSNAKLDALLQENYKRSVKYQDLNPDDFGAPAFEEDDHI